jgi:metal-responsive CopG/Arc/MetJ family transcriptional regulator
MAPNESNASQLSLLPQKKTTFTLPRELYKQLKIESAKRDKEMSAIVADALRMYLSEERQ